MNPPIRLELIGETFSPWTKKARWALELCGLHSNYKEYTPTLSEPGLRLRLKQLRGSVSVPVLLTADEVHRGSWAIANFANATSDNDRLGDMQEIKLWDELSEAALAMGRSNVLHCILNNPAAQKESLPSFIPGPLRGPLRFIALDAVKRLDRKYAHLVETDALRNALVAIREGLAEAKGDYLFGKFSYADITMAAVIEVIAPIAINHPPLGPATQSCWSNTELSNEFPDLLAWRNRLAANHATSYSQFAGVKSSE